MREMNSGKILRSAAALTFALACTAVVGPREIRAEEPLCQGWYGKQCAERTNCSNLGIYTKCVTEYLYFGWNES